MYIYFEKTCTLLFDNFFYHFSLFFPIFFYSTNSDSKIQTNKYFEFYNLKTLYRPYFVEECIGHVPFFFFFSELNIKSKHPIYTLLCQNIRRKISSCDIIRTISSQRPSLFMTEITNLRTISTILIIILVFQVIVSCFRCVLVENLIF